MPLLFSTPEAPSLAVTGQVDRFPVNRVFCVGRNYAAHAKEMGAKVDRGTPVFFLKGHHAVAHSGATLPYPPGTQDLHHEVELVVGLGAGGFEVPAEHAADLVWGYGLGLDMTRRDLQAVSKENRLPWDTGKDFENAAVFGALTPRADFGPLADQVIALEKDGETVQSAPLSDMIWPVADIISLLSRLYHLRPGDLIMTGTPAGVGPVLPGQHLHATLPGCADLDVRYEGGSV